MDDPGIDFSIVTKKRAFRAWLKISPLFKSQQPQPRPGLRKKIHL